MIPYVPDHMRTDLTNAHHRYMDRDRVTLIVTKWVVPPAAAREQGRWSLLASAPVSLRKKWWVGR